MHTLELKIIITGLLLSFGFFLIFSFINFLGPIYQNPPILLQPTELWSFVVMILIVSVWTYAVLKTMQSLYLHLRYGPREKQELKGLDKQMKSMDVFLDVAEKEFMKRKISKQTFEDIQRIAGKKIVEIKAKKKEISGEEAEEKEKVKKGK
jgi:hypothetical protein